jgi:hypothetical protein
VTKHRAARTIVVLDDADLALALNRAIRSILADPDALAELGRAMSGPPPAWQIQNAALRRQLDRLTRDQ